MKDEDKFAYLLAMLCGMKGAIDGENASTPISGNINVPETAGGTLITAAVAEGQRVEITNTGLKTILLRISGDPAFGVPNTGFPLSPGTMYVTPQPITTEIKGIAAAGETSTVHYTQFP